MYRLLEWVQFQQVVLHLMYRLRVIMILVIMMTTMKITMEGMNQHKNHNGRYLQLIKIRHLLQIAMPRPEMQGTMSIKVMQIHGKIVEDRQENHSNIDPNIILSLG